MKKAALVMAVLLLLATAACSGRTAAPDDADVESVTTLDAGVWPENDYTRGLPVPPGTVAWAMLDTRRGNCSVSVADITEDGFQDYMAQLRQAGFSPDAGTAEAVRGQDYVSIGTLLSDGERALSVSYASGTLTIYISFEKQE